MKILLNEEESATGKKNKIELFDVLQQIPQVVNYHLYKINEEINSIVKVLQQYEEIKGVFNKEQFNIQKYLDDFINGIKKQTESLSLVERAVLKDIERNNLPVTKEVKKVDNIPEVIKENTGSRKPAIEIPPIGTVIERKKPKATPNPRSEREAVESMDAFLLEDMSRPEDDDDPFVNF